MKQSLLNLSKSKLDIKLSMFIISSSQINIIIIGIELSPFTLQLDYGLVDFIIASAISLLTCLLTLFWKQSRQMIVGS